MDFGEIIKALKDGKCCYRKGWNGKGLFVYKQIPNTVDLEQIVKMKSMPLDAKLRNQCNVNTLTFNNQCIICNKLTQTADSWVPSISDIFAEDWEIHERVYPPMQAQ